MVNTERSVVGRVQSNPSDAIQTSVGHHLSRGLTIAVLVATATIHFATFASAEEPFRTDVFTAGKGGYHTYRIPALLTAKDGTLLAFCEGRKTGRGDHGDLDLVLRRSTDGGKTWSPLQVVYEEGGDAKVTIGNPCPVLDEKSGTIWLPFTRDNDDVFMTHSTDSGKSWAAPTKITADVKREGWGWYATGPGVGIQLQHGPHAGRLVVPCDHREGAAGTDRGTMYSHVIFSDDAGKTWQLGGRVGPYCNECQVIETLEDGKPILVLNMRNHTARGGGDPKLGGKRLISRSTDDGATWSKAEPAPALIEPTCQASLFRYSWSDGDTPGLVLFSNPASPKRRIQMTVRASRDDARTWPVARQIHAGSSAYSSLTRMTDGRIGLLYEADNYGRIEFAALTVEWLEGGE